MKTVPVLAIAAGVFALIWANKIRIYLKWQKKRKHIVQPFYRWPAEVHQEPDQADRLRQAREEKFCIAYQDERKMFCRIKAASDPAEVWSSLGMCQCEDFRKRHKPCKHIYKIAIDQGLI